MLGLQSKASFLQAEVSFMVYSLVIWSSLNSERVLLKAPQYHERVLCVYTAAHSMRRFGVSSLINLKDAARIFKEPSRS